MATYIVDIDGTIADASHRVHRILKTPKDRVSFNAEAVDDTPVWAVLDTVLALRESGAFIIFITGRSDASRGVTEKWLQSYGFAFEPVFMRKEGDHREDDIVKAELYIEAERKFPWLFPVTAIFEDRKKVTKMWRDRGHMVFQVAEGDY